MDTEKEDTQRVLHTLHQLVDSKELKNKVCLVMITRNRTYLPIPRSWMDAWLHVVEQDLELQHIRVLARSFFEKFGMHVHEAMIHAYTKVYFLHYPVRAC